MRDSRLSLSSSAIIWVSGSFCRSAALAVCTVLYGSAAGSGMETRSVCSPEPKTSARRSTATVSPDS